MRAYTIDGTTYYASGDGLYVESDERHDPEDLDERQTYLHDGELVRIEYRHRSVAHIKVKHWPMEARSEFASYTEPEDFTPGTPAERIRPDSIDACEECDSWASETFDEPLCIECKYGE